jgi:MEDS: MEthanogen/methylotroph, DcmR Sensory domain/STAS domain
MNSSFAATEAGRLSAGNHVCWLVDDPAAYLSRGASLLAEGKRRAQKPVLFGPVGSASFARLESAAAVAVDPLAAFLGGGQLDPAVMVKTFHEQSMQALAGGYQGLRLVADMDWLLPTRPAPGEIAAYETHLDRLAAELDATVICAYRRSSFDAAVIDGALAVHSTVDGHGADPRFRFLSAGRGRWRAAGEIDIAVSSLFRAAFTAALKYGDCVVDLRQLGFIDLSGVRAIAVGASTGAARVELQGAPSMLRRYWQVCGFGSAAPTVRFAA